MQIMASWRCTNFQSTCYPSHPSMNKYRPLQLILMLLSFFCCVAWAETPSPSEPGTGIEGLILLHSIHGGPVRQGVPDSKPLANTVFVVMKGTDTVTSFETDDQGRFRISLPPGHYSISKKDWKVRVGYYGPFEIDVVAGKLKKVQWDCDTGWIEKEALTTGANQ